MQIIVATHKQYRMPEDEMYLPLQVGAEGKADLGYARDNIGENISELNYSFCELTGLYWAWKNLDADYIGLAHYRRHFGVRRREPFSGILTYCQLLPMLGRYSVFVPRRRRYYIENLYTHYQHTHYGEHLDRAREILASRHPDYLESFDRVLRHTYGFMFNMTIMKKELLDAYCQWLFDILFELDRLVDSTGYSAYQKRFHGRVSEILLNVWLDHQVQCGSLKDREIRELPCQNMEKVNWLIKGNAFLRAKLFGVKYEGSF
ncbi:MAG: DUF4422 domain-containing protein [Muribaculum sp.]|nr:DUF4422 domain-containing protein [Muribaculum sp.]